MNFRPQLPALLIPVVIILLVLLGIFLTNLTKSQPNQPLAESQIPTPQNTQENNDYKKEVEEKTAQIDTIIKSTLDNKPGQYAVVIKDLKSGLFASLNQDKTFGAASIYKLAVMYKTYDEIEKGNISKSDLISSTTSTPQSPNPTQRTQSISYPISEALRLMITISDNDSAIFLAEKLGWANIDKFLKNNGILNFNLIGLNSPNATASDTALILEKIYKKEAVSKKASEEMINLLLGQKINDRIPKYLPKDIKVAHKTGELGSIRSDAGIVYSQKSDYIFVFLSNTPKPETTSDTIAVLSKNIFNLLEN